MISGKRDELVAGSRRRRHAAAVRHRVAVYPLIFRAAPALFSLVLLIPSYAAAENEDVAVLRRMLGELKAENRKLSRRLSALEGTSPARRTKPPAEHQRPAPAVTAAKPAPTVQSSP